MDSREPEPFARVRGQLGFCGIWCGSCAVGNGSLLELTRRYEQVITSHGLEHWAPEDLDYSKFTKGLAAIKRVASCPGCQRGGGRDDCEMRSCAQEKGLEDCTRCGERGGCSHSELLEKMRTGAVAAGLFVRTDEEDREALLKNWVGELFARWPSCVLFMDERRK